jgi:hypothetical protein
MPNPLQAASDNLENLSATMRNLDAANTLLDRLDAAVPQSRAQRAPSVKVSKVQIKTTYLPNNGGGIPVVATGITGEKNYATRITFHPKQGFHCTCPDSMQRKVACKHVAALAVECRKRFWAIYGILEEDVERLSIQIVELETAATNLGNAAATALGSFKDTLES